jgi:hypothetical protein
VPKKAFKAFRKEGVDHKGVLLRPLSWWHRFRPHVKKLGKAIAIIERTEWQLTDRRS